MSVEIVCTWCEGTDVARDAWAVWDVARQEWVLGTVFDDGFCQTCERARGLEAREFKAASEPALVPQASIAARRTSSTT